MAAEMLILTHQYLFNFKIFIFIPKINIDLIQFVSFYSIILYSFKNFVFIE